MKWIAKLKLKSYLISVLSQLQFTRLCPTFCNKRSRDLLISFKILNSTTVTRQKSESQNGCHKKTKHVKFSEKPTIFTTWYPNTEKRTVLTPWYTHLRKKFSFFGKFDMLCFLVTPALRHTILPYCQQTISQSYPILQHFENLYLHFFLENTSSDRS